MNKIELRFSKINDVDGTGIITAWKVDKQIASLTFGWPSRRRIRKLYQVQIGKVFVLEDHRREGIATKMLDLFYEHFEKDQVYPYPETTPEGDTFMAAYNSR